MSEIKKYLSDKKISESNNDFLKIKDILSPNFGYLKSYCKFHFEHNISHKRLQDFHNLCKSYSQLINNHKIIISDYNNFEELDDKINSIILENDNKKFAYKFVSNKYKFLIDDEVIRLFGELRTIDNSHSRIQSLLTSKLAAYKTIEEFKEAITKVINSFKGAYDSDTIEIEVIEAGGIVLFKNDKYLICETPSFQSCKKLGSSSWCISRSNSYFRHYAGKTGKQHILYDFTYNRSHQYAKIGVTTDIMGRINHSYDNYDYSCDYNLTYKKTNYLYKPMSKESCLSRVKDGHRFDDCVYNQLGITYEEIINIDKNYYLKLKDIDKNNIDDVIDYVSKRGGLRKNDLTKVYLEIAGDDYENLFNLLNAKFVFTEEIYNHIKKDKVATREFFRKFGSLISKDIIIDKILKRDSNFLEIARNMKVGPTTITNILAQYTYDPKSSRINNKIKDDNIEKIFSYLNYIYSFGIDTNYLSIVVDFFTYKERLINEHINRLEKYIFYGNHLRNYINMGYSYSHRMSLFKKIIETYPEKVKEYISNDDKITSYAIEKYVEYVKHRIDIDFFNNVKHKLTNDTKLGFYKNLLISNLSNIRDLNRVLSHLNKDIIRSIHRNNKNILTSNADIVHYVRIIAFKIKGDYSLSYNHETVYFNILYGLSKANGETPSVLYDGILPIKVIEKIEKYGKSR